MRGWCKRASWTAQLGVGELLDRVTVKRRKRGYSSAQAILALCETLTNGALTGPGGTATRQIGRRRVEVRRCRFFWWKSDSELARNRARIDRVRPLAIPAGEDVGHVAPC